MEKLIRSTVKLSKVIFFSSLLLILFTSVRSPIGSYDEGFAVFDSARILNGDLPYRDFWAVYPPGQIYAIAAVYKLFGTSLLTSRVYHTFVWFAVVIGFYLVARKISLKYLAYTAALAAKQTCCSGAQPPA